MGVGSRAEAAVHRMSQSCSLNQHYGAGPVLLEDYHLIEKLAQFDRERIPERVVHARGATAKGFFEVSTNVCAAVVLLYYCYALPYNSCL